MLEGLLARVADAALPFVAGRKLVAVEEALSDLATWADESAAAATAVIVAGSIRELQHKLTDVDLPEGSISIILQPPTEPVIKPGWKVIDVQYTFPDVEGIAKERAEPTLPPDERWPASRAAGGVWLDSEKPEKFLACMVIARV